MWRLPFILLTLTASLESYAQQEECDSGPLLDVLQPLAHRKIVNQQTTVQLVGLFDVHEGNNCHLLRPGGMEQVLMTIGVLEDRLMGTDVDDIAFDVYDTCTNTSMALLHLVRALSDVKKLKPSCNHKRYVGVIGPMNSQIQEYTEHFVRTLNIPYFPLRLTSLRDEIRAITEVLQDLKWKSVALFSATNSLENEFREEADSRNICITFSSTVVESSSRDDPYLETKFEELAATGIQVAVVLGSNIDLHKLYDMALASNSSIQYWLLAGLDTKESMLSFLFGPDHPVILFRKPVINVPNFDRSTVESYEFGGKINRLNLVQSYIEYVNVCFSNGTFGVALDDVRCHGHTFRTQNPQWSVIEETVDNMLGVIKEGGYLGNYTEVMRNFSQSNESNETQNEVEIWTFQHAIGKFSKHKEIQVGHYKEGSLLLDKKLLNVLRFAGSNWFKIPEFRCHQNCRAICKNFANISISSDLDNLLNRIYHWKYDTWVTVLVTVSAVGTLVAIGITAYLIIKSCREDFEEGNQITNVILLVAILFSYSCTIIFMLHNDTATCSRRITIVGIAYVSMLAPILARCFLIIAVEMDGIHGHVSGFLQSMLCFFIFAVQVAMAAYYWAMTAVTRRPRPNCMVHMKLTLAYLSYTKFLCLAWLVASPFCIRSRRNNREGLLLHLGSIAVALIWLVWYLLFFLLHPRWNEFVICFGLVSTATAVLVVVFLPKVYRMIVSSASRENGQVSMQPVIFASASSRSPNMSIYESINHGYNPDKDGYVVDTYRDEEDADEHRKMTHL